MSYAPRFFMLLAVAFVSMPLAAWGQEAEFVRGDANQDGGIDLGDAISVLNYLFGAPEHPSKIMVGQCPDAADTNDDGQLDLGDGIYLLNNLFAEGPPLPSPAGSCGRDPTPDPLSCEASQCPPPSPSITITLPGDVPLEMVWCPPGTFMMGRYPGEQDGGGNESPQHSVTLTRGFWLGKYEVTKRQWQAVMGTTPWAGRVSVLDHPDSPAVHVRWHDAQAIVARMNNLGQGFFRLPTEAEWEYACRAGTTTRFYWGDDPTYTEIKSYAWFWENAWNVGERYAHVVGLKLPNAWGLYDMSGNVWGLCQDWYASSYSDGAATDPTGPTSGSDRVLRGGSWNFYDRFCRSANRFSRDPAFRVSYVGFRLARN